MAQMADGYQALGMCYDCGRCGCYPLPAWHPGLRGEQSLSFFVAHLVRYGIEWILSLGVLLVFLGHSEFMFEKVLRMSFYFPM